MTSSMKSIRSPNTVNYRTMHSSTYDEEVGNCSISIQAGKRKLLKLSTKSPKILFFITLFSASFIFSYDDAIFDNIIASFMSTSRYDYAGLNMNGVDPHTRRLMAVKGDYENQIITSGKRMKAGKRKMEKLEIDSAVRRLSKALKITWPICKDNKMTAVECKGFIDYDILNGKDEDGNDRFLNQDKLIRTIIKGKRDSKDIWYNAIVINMNDADMVVGINNTGIVEYAWEWEGSGVAATSEQQKEILPVIGVENEAGSLGGTIASAPQSAPTEPVLGDIPLMTVTSDPVDQVTDDQVAADPLAEAAYPDDPTNVDDPNYVSQLDPNSPDYKPELDPNDPSYVPEADPMAEEYEPLILEDNILVEGADLEMALLDPLDAPIAGGIVVDPTLPNDPDADTSAFDQVIEDYITANGITVGTVMPSTDPAAGSEGDGATAPAATAPTTTTPATTTTTTTATTTPAAPIFGTHPPKEYASGSKDTDDDYITTLGIVEGGRNLPTFDCAGLTGYNCCLMIKMLVPDSDIYGKAIQCHLNYVEGSAKQSYIGNNRGKKVHIFANHNEIVSKDPKVSGNWPKEDIEAWLVDAGHEPAPVPPST